MNRIEPEKQKITCVEYQFWSSNQSREGPQLLGGRGRAARCPFPSWHCSAKCLEEKNANSSSGCAALQGPQLTPQRCGAGAAVPTLCNREQRQVSISRDTTPLLPSWKLMEVEAELEDPDVGGGDGSRALPARHQDVLRAHRAQHGLQQQPASALTVPCCLLLETIQICN